MPGEDLSAAPSARLELCALRLEYPALHQEVHPGVPLVYLDSAATALKPWPVIRTVQRYDTEYSASVHRGLHALSERATEEYESARERVARFIGATEAAEVIFTRGTTESINLVSLSWGRAFLRPGDEVVLTLMEHHANLIPWQMLAREIGLQLKFADITPDGRLDLASFARQLSTRTRLVALTAMSNVLGSFVPLEEIIDCAHRRWALVVVDAAQAVAHRPLNVAALDADFVAFSGHKLGGPTGVGVLYAKREHLEAMPPLFGGGSMGIRVNLDGAEWNDVPWKFEAGTPPIAQAIGLGAAVDFLTQLGWPALQQHERELTDYAHWVLEEIDGVQLLGPSPEQKGGIVGFTVEGVHPHDLAHLLDRAGVAIRAGHHCAMPLHDRLGIAASARASFAPYNTKAEIDDLAEAIAGAKRRLQRDSIARRPDDAR
jgi:cysteine desulfurase/selenocysteine lyase